VKTLLLLRHAKSSWDHPGLADHDRPLAARGRRDAPRIGRYLADIGLLPERVLCSTANRTQATWERVQAALPRELPLRLESAIYGADVAELMDLIRHQDDDCSSVMLIGHNPGLEMLADRLIGSGSQELRRDLRMKYPTAALAEIRFAIDHWAELAPHTGELLRYIRPSDLPG
jgi:phosphohistidine phosphatase